MPKQVPWDKIEKDYVTGMGSLDSLRKKWRVSQRALELHCSNDNWVQKREDWRAQTAAWTHENIEQRIQEDLGIQVTDITLSHYRATRRFIGMIETAQGSLEKVLKAQDPEQEEHDDIERERDPKNPAIPGSLLRLASLTPMIREWVNILNICVRLERELLALQFEHPAIAIQYLSQLGYEIKAAAPQLSAAQAPGQAQPT